MGLHGSHRLRGHEGHGVTRSCGSHRSQSRIGRMVTWVTQVARSRGSHESQGYVGHTGHGVTRVAGSRGS